MKKEIKEKIIEILSDCSWKKIAEFNYRNSKGEKSYKRVEVYNVDPQNNSFFGYDLKDQKIKHFKFDQIENYIEVGEEFKPRYEKEKI